ncbi:MAG: ANTAR domain-containing protein [Alphaproteobacteria bacterium]|nr:MAG: ANTAR domain-containing protein [Alphaproteobacteria bacterium]
MIPPRTIKNFCGFRGLWLGPSGAAATMLAGTMERLGAAFEVHDELVLDELSVERDICFVDGDSLFDPASLCAPGRHPRIPVIGVVGSEAPSRLKALSDVGATALLRKPIHPSTVYSALFLATNNHARLARLVHRIAEQDRRHGGRRFVIKAVVKLIQEQGLCDEQAFALLRRESMRLRIGIEEYAKNFCSNASPQESRIDAHQDDATRDRRDVDELGTDADERPGSRPDQTRRA